MIEAYCVDGPLAGQEAEAGPRGVVGFAVSYPGTSIFETGRYDLVHRRQSIARPVLVWREFPMSLDEACIIAEGWEAADARLAEHIESVRLIGEPRFRQSSVRKTIA